MSEMVSTVNIPDCDPPTLLVEVKAGTFTGKFDFLNCTEKPDGTWDIDMCVTEALTTAEDTEYQAILTAHNPV